MPCGVWRARWCVRAGCGEREGEGGAWGRRRAAAGSTQAGGRETHARRRAAVKEARVPCRQRKGGVRRRGGERERGGRGGGEALRPGARTVAEGAAGAGAGAGAGGAGRGREGGGGEGGRAPQLPWRQEEQRGKRQTHSSRAADRHPGRSRLPSFFLGEVLSLSLSERGRRGRNSQYSIPPPPPSKLAKPTKW